MIWARDIYPVPISISTQYNADMELDIGWWVVPAAVASMVYLIHFAITEKS